MAAVDASEFFPATRQYMDVPGDQGRDQQSRAQGQPGAVGYWCLIVTRGRGRFDSPASAADFQGLTTIQSAIPGLGLPLYRGTKVAGIVLEVGAGLGSFRLLLPMPDREETQQTQADAYCQDQNQQKGRSSQ